METAANRCHCPVPSHSGLGGEWTGGFVAAYFRWLLQGFTARWHTIGLCETGNCNSEEEPF